ERELEDLDLRVPREILHRIVADGRVLDVEFRHVRQVRQRFQIAGRNFFMDHAAPTTFTLRQVLVDSTERPPKCPRLEVRVLWHWRSSQSVGNRRTGLGPSNSTSGVQEGGR